MIHYKELDATSINTGIIAHGVNCQHRMASGIAKTIREKFPEAYNAYMRNPKGPNMLGTAHVICVDHNTDLHVANMYTQVFYGYGGGKYADAQAIEDSLRFVAGVARAYNLPIFMPRIGCGLGGLNWKKDVEPAVERVASEFPEIDIVVCDLPQKETDNELVTY